MYTSRETGSAKPVKPVRTSSFALIKALKPVLKRTGKRPVSPAASGGVCAAQIQFGDLPVSEGHNR